MLKRKLRYFWYEFQRELEIFINIAIIAIGFWTILYGVLLLYEYFATGKWGRESVDTVTMIIAIGGAAIIALGFIITLIFALVRTARYDPSKDMVVDSKVVDKIPSINIVISSKDIRRMNANQIKLFFKGTKQSLVEYRKSLKESHKYKQEIIKKQSSKNVK